jgi:hypothetical protein
LKWVTGRKMGGDEFTRWVGERSVRDGTLDGAAATLHQPQVSGNIGAGNGGRTRDIHLGKERLRFGTLRDPSGSTA